jgi:hypothetical protein
METRITCGCGIHPKVNPVGFWSFNQGEFMLQMNLWDKALNINWNLLVVYGTAHEEKLAFLAKLSHFCASNSEPMIFGGDFNIIRYINEKNSMDGVHRYTPLFNSLIHFYELREIVMTGGMFMWSNNQEVSTLEKLDRVLVTKDWEDIFPQASICKLPREIFDHNPLIMSTGRRENVPFIQFRFELGWLKNPDFLPIVEKIWIRPCRAKSAIDKIQ